MTFSQVISSLNVVVTNLDVTGNNIANSATYGFKSGAASSADMFAGSRVGLGVKVVDITQDSTDGTTTNTGRDLGAIINQNGFFRMVDSNGSVLYSRNGQFKFDESCNIVNVQGPQPIGHPVIGMPSTVQQGANPAPVTIPNTLMAAKSTTTASMQTNLSSADKVPTKTSLNPSDTDSHSKKGSATAFDSQGNAHDMNIFCVKNAQSDIWEVFTQDASTGESINSAGFMRLSESDALLGINVAAVGAPARTDINIATGEIGDATETTFSLNFLNSMQQNTGTNNIVATNQNGYKLGDLVNYQINNDDTVVGNYSNEQQRVLGQIALADFANNEGLASRGDNVRAATRPSGVVLLGTAGEGNFGRLADGTLEASNVDLGKELMNMIIARRNYQSNAQTIKTQDQILNTLINLR